MLGLLLIILIILALCGGVYGIAAGNILWLLLVLALAVLLYRVFLYGHSRGGPPPAI